MVRILHVFGNLGRGGAESRIIDLYRHMDLDRVQFDFVVHYEADETGEKCPSSDTLMAVRKPDYFDEAVHALGANIYAVPRFKGLNLIEYRKAWTRLFEEHPDTWKAVQGHMTSTASIYLPIAKAAGIPITIAHARSAGTDPGLKGAMTRFIRRPLQDDGVCDFSFACTKDAARAVFGDKKVNAQEVTILPNAIEPKKFAYNEDARERIRKEFNLTNAIVIGHVGRLHYAKNHEYLMKVFAEVLNRLSGDFEAEEGWTSDADYSLLHGLPCKLLLVGTGVRYAERIRALPEEYGIAEHVIFAGDRDDANEFYSAFDYFCFPSLYEGLPATVIEAQASGLQCLVSDSVTKDVGVTPLVRFRSIQDDARIWAERILDDLILRKEDEADGTGQRLEYAGDRRETTARIFEKLKEAGFDVEEQAKRMMRFYESGSFDT